MPRITAAQMNRWRKMEAEHSPRKQVQSRIVRQHVAEYGMKYYPALKRMEARLKKK